MFSVWFQCCWFVLGVYGLFFILLFFFIPLVWLFISFVFNFLVGVFGVGMGVVFEWFLCFWIFRTDLKENFFHQVSFLKKAQKFLKHFFRIECVAHLAPIHAN